MLLESVFLACTVWPLVPQEPADFVGCWEGTIEVADLFVEVALRLDGDELVGTCDIPAQGAAGLELEVLRRDGAEIELRIAGIPGDPTFDGAIETDPPGLSGTFRQHGGNMPFALTPCEETGGAPGELPELPAFGLDPETPEATIGFSLMGADGGEAVAQRDAGGLIRSRSRLLVPGQEIVSLFEGWNDPGTGDWTAFRMTIEVGDVGQEARFDGERIHRPGGGAPLEWSGGPIFSSQHPALMDGFFQVEKETTLEALVLDQITLTEVGVMPVKARVVAGEALDGVRIDLEGLEIFVWRSRERGIVGFDVPVQRFQAAEPAIAAELFVDPIAAFPELSQNRFEVEVTAEVPATMRDGVDLISTVTRPIGEGPFPTVLVRTCYGRELSALEGSWWAARGYVHVVQDVRGRGDSGGRWDPFQNERLDGHDTVDWIADQPWSNGKVGMIGASYLGFVQWQAAVERPEALCCIVPQVSPPHPFFNIPWDHGLFLLSGNVWWSKIVQGREADMSSFDEVPGGGEALATLPLTAADDAVFGESIAFYDEWLKRDSASAWDAATLVEVAGVDIPVLAISGTWDGDGIGTRLQWEARRDAGHEDQWLIYGPWQHAFNTETKFGGRDYGPDSILDLDPVYLRFFDTYLLGKDVGWEETPAAQVFLTGANRWLDLDDFDDPSFEAVEWFLSAPTPANGPTSGGLLVPAPAASAPSRWLYNPARTAVEEEDLSTESSAAQVTLEIEEAEQGVLLFRGPVFDRKTEVGGSIEVELAVETTARDAALHAFLVDEHPDGQLDLVGLPGNLRLGFDGDGITPVEPGSIRRVVVDPWWFCHEFPEGHRMTLVVTSDRFPGFARTLGLGEPDAEATDMVSACHTLHHDPSQPSSVRFRMRKPMRPGS